VEQKDTMGKNNDGLSLWQAEADGIDLLAVTPGQFLDQCADERPEQEALVYSGYPEAGGALDIRWTYREYRDRVDAVARGLLAAGFQKGEHIAIWAINLPQWPLLELAASKAGLVLVTINPVLRAQEVEYILQQGDVVALFLMARVRDHDCLATIRERVTPGAAPGEVSSTVLPRLRFVSLLGTPPPDLPGAESWRPLLFHELLAAGQGVSRETLHERQASVRPDDPAQILYTSGTTGFPKGAIQTQQAILNNGRIFALRWGVQPGDRLCTAMPFFHAGGCVLGILATLSIGATLYPLVAFDPLKTLQVISSERCSHFGGVPTMLIALLQHPDFASFDLSSLKSVVSGGSSVPVYLMEQVSERMGANATIVFGQTEASAAITLTRQDDSFALKSATVGVPMPHTEVKIIDPASGRIVACGERGELLCRGYLVMAAYYQMAEKTAQAIDGDNWLHTGDLATMDAQGYVQIVGRLKDMVIRGGENIFPREVEEFLIRHPQVADVQIVGVPDPFFGEELLAVVVPQAGARVSEADLRAYCQGQISHQKIPRYFQFVTSYPLTASGKVQKFLLRENAVKALGLAAQAGKYPA
jgi:fatty-acyl-CoA synthase